MTACRDSSITHQRDTHMRITSTEDQQFSVCAPLYGVFTTFTPTEVVRKCLTTFKMDPARGQETSKNTEEKIPDL